MKKAKIIVALVLLTFSLSGCANAERFEVSAPSSQETVTTEPAQSTVPQESTAVSVSESTEIPAERIESFFPNLDTGMIMLKRDTPARLIAFAISTMFLPAITEESFYRKSIISFRSKPALVLSAVFGMLLYAAEHSLKPWGIFLTAIWALPLTISYIRTKNVYVPMTAHFIVNVFGNGVTVIMTIVAMCK